MVSRAAREPSHTMELPRRIVIGMGTLGGLGSFAESLAPVRRVSLVSGPHVQKTVRRTVDRSLGASRIAASWHEAPPNDRRSFGALARDIRADSSALVIGVGGGRAVDAAKSAAFKCGLPFLSVPTAASHDGIASPFVSVRGTKPHSLVANAPLGILVDIRVIKKAPPRLLASGCGDLIANIVAVRDWELGHDATGEYYGTYAANLARLSAETVIKNAPRFLREGADVRMIVEALISAGVAAGIAGSSRPCSGAEHLFSHALDRIAPGVGLHGEKCGIGAIMTAKLQGQDWKALRRTLAGVGAPTSAAQIGLGEDDVTAAMTMAQSLRPGRYTILSRIKMTERRARSLARLTGVT